MKKVLLLFFYINVFFSFSQKKNIEKDLAYLINQKPTSIEAIHTVFKPYRKNKEHLTLLLNKSKTANYKEGSFYATEALGRYYRDISLFNKALEAYQKALTIAKELEITYAETRILNAIASVYRRQNDVINALNYYQESLNKALAIKNPNLEIKKTISVSQNGMGNIYIILKQYQLALKEFNKSILFEKEINDKLGLAINYKNIGKVKEQLGYLDIALQYYEKALSYNNEINSAIGRVICGYNIANVLIKQKKYKKAYTTVTTILPIAIKEKDKYYIANIYNTLGLVQIHLNQLKKAEKNLTTALSIAEKTNIRNIIVKTNLNLALLHKKNNHYKKAYLFYKIAKDKEAFILNDKNLAYTTKLVTDYEKQRTNIKIKNLEAENQQVTNIALTSIAIVFLLSLIFITWYGYRSLSGDKKILSLKQEALQNQMNPHFVFNALNSIKLYIINNEQKKAAYYLNKFSKLIRIILESSKVKQTTLREELETMELYMSIENIRFNNEIIYTFDVDKTLNLDEIKIPPLILQPFLENAIWHGLSSKKGIKKINLSIKKIAQKFAQISIEDNGIGRNASAKIKANKKINRKSIGIELTKERLSSFIKNFSLRYFDLTDAQGLATGTKVSIRIPLG